MPKSCFLAALLCCAFSASEASVEPPKLRLGEDVRPVRYSVELTLIPDEDTFSGAIEIDLDIRKPAEVISVPTAAAKDSFLLYVGDGRIVNRPPIRVDDARLRMGRMAERLAKQAFGGAGVAQPRKQEVNRGSGRIDGAIQVAPAAFHSKSAFLQPTKPLPLELQHIRSLFWASNQQRNPLIVLGESCSLSEKGAIYWNSSGTAPVDMNDC
jgi:hypothetical protein